MFFIPGISMLYGQATNIHTLDFYPAFGNSDLVLADSVYKLKSGDSIRFETLKFYISNIELLYGDKTVWKEENSFHLLDAANEKSLHISLTGAPNIPVIEIKFNVGIDSVTNVSGVMGGDLDPTKGMYWTWQSGYINFKLEGKSNMSKSRNNEFQFHLGGYEFPFNSCQTIVLNSTSAKPTITIDIERFVNEIDFANENHIMTPGKEAVLLSKKLVSVFSIKE